VNQCFGWSSPLSQTSGTHLGSFYFKWKGRTFGQDLFLIPKAIETFQFQLFFVIIGCKF
jgi:hypothetical protein